MTTSTRLYLDTDQHAQLQQTAQTQAMRQRSKSITVRRPRFVAHGLGRHYLRPLRLGLARNADTPPAPSPLLSHLLTALSMTFPVGEQFFVQSVRQVRDQVADAALQADISAFIGQESMHSLAHDAFNQGIRADDYHLERYAVEMTNQMDALRGRTPRRQLAATVAYEHFTALIAAYILRRAALYRGFDDNMARLWLWHAVEEIEHKSVAFDVYQTVFGDLAQRRRSMRTVSVGFVLGVVTMTTDLLWQDRRRSLYGVRPLLQNSRDALTLGRMVLALLPRYVDFYRADFHPSQHEDQALLKAWQERLGAMGYASGDAVSDASAGAS